MRHCILVKYNETGGGNASTTGNVYGIYDMAGGAWEYVAGYLSEITALTNYTTLASADSKYKDVYAGTSSDRTTNYNANTGKYTIRKDKTYFGMYDSLDIAKEVKEKLIEENWDKSKLNDIRCELDLKPMKFRK